MCMSHMSEGRLADVLDILHRYDVFGIYARLVVKYINHIFEKFET